MLNLCFENVPALRTSYAVAGRLLCVDALDEWSAGVVGRHFRDWHITPAAAARPDATIIIRRGGELSAAPRGIESFPLDAGGRCHTDGRTYRLDLEGSRVLFGGHAGGAVEVLLDEGSDAAAQARAVVNAFSAAMRRCELFELHSACVVEPETRRGFLLAGASGSGKTTLTMRLAAAGWGYLSDDVLLLSEREGRVEARPLRRVFAATAATAAAAGLPPPTLPAGAKLRFAPQEFFPRGFVESCRPEVIVFPSVARERESRVNQLAPAEALARLLRMCPWASYDRPTSAGYLRTLSLVARGCRAFELRAGSDILEDPARAAELLAGC